MRHCYGILNYYLYKVLLVALGGMTYLYKVLLVALSSRYDLLVYKVLLVPLGCETYLYKVLLVALGGMTYLYHLDARLTYFTSGT